MRKKNTTFAFKHFELDQADCAMKINTDGVLLGAMVNPVNPLAILDVGTGTGIIALMLAQRFPEAHIDAIEIDALAAERAKSNAASSPFASRIAVFHGDYADYNPQQKYDLIVSNPPFFVNDLRNQELRKGIARHTDLDFFKSFAAQSARMLTESGSVYVVLPPKIAEAFVALCQAEGFYLNKQINIHSDAQKTCFRVIIGLSKHNIPPEEHAFYIYAAYQEHTAAYKQLLKDFFLAF